MRWHTENMPEFNESQINRDAGGKFAAKSTGAADIDLPTTRVVDTSSFSGGPAQIASEVDEIRVVTEDGSSHIEVDYESDFTEDLAQSYEDDGTTDDGAAYVAERGELIESYAREAWDAELDNTRNWDDKQLMTFRYPAAGDDAESIEDAVDRASDNGGNHSIEKFSNEMSTSGGVSGLRQHLNRCDEQLGAADRDLKKAGIDDATRAKHLAAIRSKMAEDGPMAIETNMRYGIVAAKHILSERASNTEH